MKKKRLSDRGYLTEKGREYYHKIITNKLEKDGYIKNGKMEIRFNSKPQTLKKGDLVITFEIHKVIGKFDGDEKNEFSVVDVLPCCSVLNCIKTGCGHEGIKSTGFGQQGITKILKQK